MVYFRLTDGKLLEVPDATAAQWDTVRECIEDCEDDDSTIIPLPTESATATAVLFLARLTPLLDAEKASFASKTSTPYASQRIPSSQTGEFTSVPFMELITVLALANFVQYLHGVAAVSRFIGSVLATKTVAEIKLIFGIEGPMTPEDKTRVAEINPWLA